MRMVHEERMSFMDAMGHMNGFVARMQKRILDLANAIENIDASNSAITHYIGHLLGACVRARSIEQPKRMIGSGDIVGELSIQWLLSMTSSHGNMYKQLLRDNLAQVKKVARVCTEIQSLREQIARTQEFDAQMRRRGKHKQQVTVFEEEVTMVEERIHAKVPKLRELAGKFQTIPDASSDTPKSERELQHA